MRYLSYYFGHHKDPNILLVVGDLFDNTSVIELLKTSSFENVYISKEDDYWFDKFKDEIINELDEKSLQNVHFIRKNQIFSKDFTLKDFALVFDHTLNLGEMISYKVLKPKKLVASLREGFETFYLWEAYRDVTDEINISRFVNYFRNEVLDWKRNPETDIELSVIFPVYKVEKYLDKCIETVTSWDAPYIEFIFVDDGSPDNSAKVISEYSKRDKRIKLLSKENGGCASARQYGIDHSKGRYIGLIDPDDFVEKDMFKKLLSRALTGTYDIAYGGYYEYYEETGDYQQIEDLTGEPYTAGTSDVKLIDDLIAYRRIAIWRGIYKRELLDKYNIRFHTEIKRFDDLPFKVETLARAKSVVSIDEPLYYYRMGRPGQDVSVTDNRLLVHFDIFAILDEFFKKPRSSYQELHYYQVKVQTHYWAITSISKEYLSNYLQKAADDLHIKNTKSSWKKLIKRYYRKPEVDLFLKCIK